MEKGKIKAFVSWSGGKESSLACYRAMQRENLKVSYFLNMVSEDGRHSRSHGIGSELLKSQAEAMDIPIVQKRASWGNYEEEFKKALSDFKTKGIRAGIFGDIDLEEHRDWVERVCTEVGLNAILPLWKGEREDLVREFMNAGFKAIVCATNADFLGSEWLGRIIDEEFVRDLRDLGNIDLCGEKGEYHTLVYDGPVFKKPVGFHTGKKILKERHWFLEIRLK